MILTSEGGNPQKIDYLLYYIRFHQKDKNTGNLEDVFGLQILNMDIDKLRISDFDGNLFFPTSMFFKSCGFSNYFLKREGIFKCYFKLLLLFLFCI